MDSRTFSLADRAPSTAPKESGVLSSARDREQSVDQEEHVAAVLRMRRSTAIGLVIWLAFAFADWMVVTYIEPGRLSRYYALRAIGTVMIVGILIRVSRQPMPSKRLLGVLEILLYGGASVLISIMCLEFRGIASPYYGGIMVILICRSVTMPENWRRAVWLLGVPGLTALGGERDFVKVLDFGIAKMLASDDGASLTETGWALGTPAYISPEAAMGQPVDARADVYALGAVLYLLLTGVPPFTGENAAALLVAHAKEAPLRPSLRLGAPVPDDVEAIVLRCLAKEPERRFASGRELAAALAEAAEAHPYRAEGVADTEPSPRAGRVSRAAETRTLELDDAPQPIDNLIDT